MGIEYPWFLLLLFLLPWYRRTGLKDLFIQFSPVSWSKENSSPKLKDSQPSMYLVEDAPKQKFSHRLVYFSEWAVFVFLILGISSPYISTQRDSVKLEGIDLVVTMDLSASMQAEDFTPNRLEAMKIMVKEYLAEGRGNRTALSVFSGKVFLHYPFTRDKYALQSAVESLHFQTINHGSAGGTAIGDALLFSVDMLEKVKIEDRKQAIILITDGENTEGVDPILAAKSCLEKGIHLYIIGLASLHQVPVFVRGNPYLGADGTQLVTSLEDKSLREIASEGGGVYYRATQGASLRRILSEIQEIEKHPLELNKVQEKFGLGFIFSIVAFISFCLYFLGGSLWIRRPLR